ncbi:ubiquinone biosynthesis protein COQ9, mitochondrial [Acrasis kona]|uniref:Ubiquinone biosynthesis protein n=1 Tax=Acrasis kona TaxID=1008807 RepID=A0AAW2ZHX1_9EUKA
MRRFQSVLPLALHVKGGGPLIIQRASLFIFPRSYVTFDPVVGLQSMPETQTYEDVNDLKNKILDEAIDEFVPIHGWTEESVTQAVKKHNFSGVAHSQLFQKGQIDLIQHFITRSNQKMSATIQLMDKSKMLERDILYEAIKLRLEQVAPFIKNGTWTEAMSAYLIGPRGPLNLVNQLFTQMTSTSSLQHEANPLHSKNAAYHLAILADELCFLINQHKDTNINWYAKRAAIAGIYATTELHMLNDKSQDFKDTWEFLDRRIDGALTVKGYWDTIGDVIGLKH